MDLTRPAKHADSDDMRYLIFGIYVLGAAFVCGIISLAVANRVPDGLGLPVQLLAAVGGGYYGYRQAKKNEAARLSQ
jgi:hypothetical protein